MPNTEEAPGLAPRGEGLKIGITGCAGRMGRMLIAEVLATPYAHLMGGCEVESSPHIGADLATLVGQPATGAVVGHDAGVLFEMCDVVIDFTAPSATAAHAMLAAAHDTALVIGTTGLTADAQDIVQSAATLVPIVQAPNFSVGVNLMFVLTETVAAILGNEYDIEIVEMHHRHKVDAPSGTALGLGHAAAAGRGVDLDTQAVMSREGHTGPRREGTIGFATVRGGDVVGDHTVIFAGPGERLELTHKAATRDVFAKGAVRAALWTAGRDPGFYGMADVLGLTE